MLQNQRTLKKLMMGNHGPPAYMYDAWNYLDLTVLVVSYTNAFLDLKGPFKIIRVLRAFRPLRMISRIGGMKAVLGALFDALPAYVNVCVLLVMTVLIFGIVGVSLFMGKFASCNDRITQFSEGSDIDSCYGHNMLNSDDYWTPKVDFPCLLRCK